MILRSRFHIGMQNYWTVLRLAPAGRQHRMQLVAVTCAESSYLMVQLIAADQHMGELIGDFFLQKATVDEILSDFLNLVDSRV